MAASMETLFIVKIKDATRLLDFLKNSLAEIRRQLVEVQELCYEESVLLVHGIFDNYRKDELDEERVFVGRSHLKSLVYDMPLSTMEDLTTRIIVASDDISSTSDLFEHVRWFRLCYDLMWA
ncbi:hypothetical protein TNCV_1045931 [Trichonephila clavipes]|nr:hypothetical protein TNCV_1045931 [Trichonephila clavipes]